MLNIFHYAKYFSALFCHRLGPSWSKRLAVSILSALVPGLISNYLKLPIGGQMIGLTDKEEKMVYILVWRYTPHTWAFFLNF